MPLQLPNLDDRRYKDLVEEGRSLIPAYSPEWTNHNPSDPGITLVELFAYLTEMSIYRLNRVTDENRKKFLKLLNDPAWTPGQDLISDTRDTVSKIREIYRAVTCADHEELVTEQFNQFLSDMQQNEREGKSLQDWWDATGLDSTSQNNHPLNMKQIKRARCVARKNLEAGTESGRREEKPDHVSVMIVPDEQWQEAGKLGPSPAAEQLEAVRAYLDERRVLTTRLHVVAPLYAPIGVEAVIIRKANSRTDATKAVEQLREFFNPLPENGESGWPFGRDVYVSEVCEELEKVDGIDYIADLMLTSEHVEGQSACLPAESIWHDEGDLIGLEISEHLLPSDFAVNSDKIVVVPASQVLVVNVTVGGQLSTSASAEPASAKRRIKQAIRAFFHPLYNGPSPDNATATELKIADLKSQLTSTGDFQQVDSVTMRTDAACYVYDGTGAMSGVKAEAGMIIDVRLRLNV